MKDEFNDDKYLNYYVINIHPFSKEDKRCHYDMGHKIVFQDNDVPCLSLSALNDARELFIKRGYKEEEICFSFIKKPKSEYVFFESMCLFMKKEDYEKDLKRQEIAKDLPDNPKNTEFVWYPPEESIE